MTNVLELFISFLSAFIIKDFYDMLIREHIILGLRNYKKLLTTENKRRNKK